MAGLRPFVVNIVLCIVFSVFIIYFAIGFPAWNNNNSTIVSQSHMNSTLANLTNAISDFSNTSTGVYSQMGSSNPSPTDYLFLIFQGAFYIPWTFLKFTFAAIGSIANIVFISFGGGLFGGVITIMMGVVSSILIITLVLYIIKAIRSGEVDH